MKEFGSFGAFAAFLRTREAAAVAAQKEGMHEAADMLRDEAQALIGTQDPEWPALADITVAMKEKAGHTGRVSHTDPLLATGHLRGSIETTTEPHDITLGTHDPIAPEQEFGTRRIPPRPFIGTTMFRHAHEAVDIISSHIVAAIATQNKPRRRRRGRSAH